MHMQEKERPKHSAKFLRQRKFLMVLPLLVLPFGIFGIWMLGLVGDVKAEGPKHTQGINLNLPNAAAAKDSNWNKMKYYEQADRDSMRLRAMLKNDPYRKLEVADLLHAKGMDTSLAPLEDKDKDSYRPARYDPYPAEKQREDPQERRVRQRLKALQQEMDRAEVREREKTSTDKRSKATVPEVAAINPDVQKLEAMMQGMQQGGTEEDPELQQLNGLLEKILDVQHPERVENKLQRQSEQNKRQVFPVQTKSEDIISVLETKSNWNALLQDKLPDSTAKEVQQLFDRNRFYSLDDDMPEAGEVATTVEAFVSETQTLLNGATLQLRLLQELYINGVRIPKQSPVSGIVSIKNNRLQVVISSIYYHRSVFPVNLTVYGKDGMPGLPLDASSLNDAAKQTMTGTMQGIDVGSLDPSIGAQAASAGIQAAKTLMNKKTKLIKMTVPAGYTVLLVDGNNKDK